MAGVSDWSELVLDIAGDVPPGHATTYGLVSEAARARTGRGSARSVGAVMAREGAAVAWWRVVRADGTLPEHLAARAASHYDAEGTARRPGGAVDLALALWDPLEETHA
jgi:methylated-DNA-protein-cysteine methyltransferase-like protein